MDRYAIATNKTPPPDTRSPLDKELWDKNTNIKSAIDQKILSIEAISQIMGYSQEERDLYDRTFRMAGTPTSGHEVTFDFEDIAQAQDDDQDDEVPEETPQNNEEDQQTNEPIRVPMQSAHLGDNGYIPPEAPISINEAIQRAIQRLGAVQQDIHQNTQRGRGHIIGNVPYIPVPLETIPRSTNDEEYIQVNVPLQTGSNRNRDVYEGVYEGYTGTQEQKPKKPRNLRYKLIKKSARKKKSKKKKSE
jgi:hypothetical protein